ncbi:uncharacterized protein LOC134256979 [Saccostrea cucullata]|uniref:uncharacterized protein LOC134256979 n=1 Tax=Saccostrea cuccullata TaxID=36930 RepID=UPI002ED3E673
MDPLDRAQVLLLCDLCEKAALQSHCELCQINLCKTCVGEHLSDSLKRHNVVPYKHRTPNYPKCPEHTQKYCELYCEKCDIPVCSTCISSGKHDGHKLKDILERPGLIKEILKRDLEDLEEIIYPTYAEIASDLNSEKLSMEKHYDKLTTAVTKQGEDWHNEINDIVKKQKSEIEEMRSKSLAVLNKKGREIEQILSDVKESLFNLKKILNSNDDSLASAYKSRNAEFRNLPHKVHISFPSFSPYQINTEQLNQMIGSLSALSITTDDHGYTLKTKEPAVFCPPIKRLLNRAELVTTIITRYYIYSVICLSNDEIWTCGDRIMKLYNIHGKSLKSIQTNSENKPRDIAVTRSGDLVYTDPDARTVNIVKNDQIKEVIRLQGWTPYYICITSSGDLLVTMDSEDDEQSKVVRYSVSRQNQTIQYGSEGKPLYSSSTYTKYISENRNMDICVADYTAQAIVVVNQTGKLRFRYTGHPSATKRSFNPFGISTDSLSQILTADYNTQCIHILDQDGKFLRYIDHNDYCDLRHPWGLCVDTKDNLFVSDANGGKVRKIKYMQAVV